MPDKGGWTQGLQSPLPPDLKLQEGSPGFAHCYILATQLGAWSLLGAE